MKKHPFSLFLVAAGALAIVGSAFVFPRASAEASTVADKGVFSLKASQADRLTLDDFLPAGFRHPPASNCKLCHHFKSTRDSEGAVIARTGAISVESEIHNQLRNFLVASTPARAPGVNHPPASNCKHCHHF
jgi:hypothetical protein